MNTTPDETEKDEKKETIQYPNIVERFREVFQKLTIKKSEAYVDHCSKGDLEDLVDVDKRLFEMGLHPSLRNQVINFWASEIKKPVPQTLQKRLAEERGTKPREENEGSEEAEKYSVDTDSGAIKVASTSDKRALTWDEAEKLAKEMKKDIEARAGNEKEPAFVLGEQGAWTVNPKAKVGLGEFAVYQMYQDSLRRGDPIDPIEELARREEASAHLKEAMGIKAVGGDTEMGMIDKLDKLGMLKKSEGGEGGLLTLLNSMGLLKKPGEEDAGSQKIGALETQIKELAESLHKQEMETIKNAVVNLSTQLTELRKDMATGTQLEGRYALLEKTITTIDNQLSGIRTDVKPIIIGLTSGSGGAEPAKKSPEAKARLSKGLKEAVAQEKEAKALEDELLFGGKVQS